MFHDFCDCVLAVASFHQNVNVVSVRKALCSTLYMPLTLEGGRCCNAPIIGSQHIMEALYLQVRHRVMATAPDIDLLMIVQMMPKYRFS